MNKSVGDSIIEGLGEFRDAVKSGRPIAEQLTCRRVALDLTPTHYNAKTTKETRKMFGVSQAVFARFLGVSKSTVQAWEQGANRPNDIASRFMDEIRHDLGYWQNRLREVTTSRTPA